MHLNKLVIFLFYFPTPLLAAWSGVSLTVGDETIPVVSDTEQIRLTAFTLKLDVEDKTVKGLRIGANMSRVGVKTKSSSTNITSTGDALGLYVYYPYQFNDVVSIIGRFSFSLVDTIDDANDKAGVEYIEKSLSLGLALKWRDVRITTMINVRGLDGDFKDASNTNPSFSFRQESTRYVGLYFDYFIEKNSFIRLTVDENSDNTFRISFATIY